MTTASNSDSSLIDNTWPNQDCAQRLVTLEKLDPSDANNSAFLIKIAQEDEHEPVRCLAISRIARFDVLEKIQQSGGKVKESAQQQIVRVIAGSIESEHSELERIEKLKALPAAGIKQVALITKLKTIADLAVEAIELNEDLADLCLFAGYLHVRKSAAQKIEDTTLLKELLARIAGKDKTVSKLIDARLNSQTSVAAASPETETETETIAEPDKEQDADAPVPTEAKKQAAKKVSKEAPAPLEPGIELDALEKESTKLSFKNTARLFEVRSQLRKLKARLATTDTALAQRIESLQSAMDERIAKNNDYQQRLQEKTQELLIQLAVALEAGNSEEATQCWDKIQGNISNTANQVRAELQKRANEHKEKITELRDWKIFAATEKKKELITQMQHLLDSKMHASDRSKSISKLHKEWKALGRSNQNEQLWKQFKTLSDQAYEPCKEYFKQRKKQMAENFKKRRELCDLLEAELHRLGAIETETDTEIDVSALNKLLNQADKDWKLYAPIEQNKIKSLQNRYYGIVNKLRKIRKSNLSGNAKQKQDLIAQAQELAKHEDRKHAMNEAKRLQQDWKKIGPTSYKDDNRYWQEFRAACDAIFDKRDRESGTQKEELTKIEARLKEILNQLDAIASMADAEFRESRSSYKDLAQEFSNSLDPRIKSSRKRMLDRFNQAKRQIDSRFRALPDKRQQRMQEIVRDKASRLQSLEHDLLGETDTAKYAERLAAFDTEAWQAIEASGNAEVDELLQQRLDSTTAAKGHSELLKQCQRCEERYRILCIEAEIRANSDSPAEDKALRMKLQLEQLQSGFGQAKPDPKQNLKYAMDIELQSMAMGPLDAASRERLSSRMQQILQKLR